MPSPWWPQQVLTMTSGGCGLIWANKQSSFSISMNKFIVENLYKFTVTSSACDRVTSKASSASFNNLYSAELLIVAVCVVFTFEIFRFKFIIGLIIKFFIFKIKSVSIRCFDINPSKRSKVFNIVFITSFVFSREKGGFFLEFSWVFGRTNVKNQSSIIFSLDRNFRTNSWKEIKNKKRQQKKKKKGKKEIRNRSYVKRNSLGGTVNSESHPDSHIWVT